MKKFLVLILALVVVMAALTACGAKEDKEEAEPEAGASVESLKTMGEVNALEKEDAQLSVGDGKAVSAFKYEDKYYRVVADIPEDVEKKYIDVDMTKEGYEKEQEEILAPVKITKVEDLDELILKNDELEALKGKTGKELVADGWVYNGSYNMDEKVVWMNNGPFTYSVKFDGDYKGAGEDDFDVEKETKNSKVESVEFSSLGDASVVD